MLSGGSSKGHPRRVTPERVHTVESFRSKSAPEAESIEEMMDMEVDSTVLPD